MAGRRLPGRIGMATRLCGSEGVAGAVERGNSNSRDRRARLASGRRKRYFSGLPHSDCQKLRPQKRTARKLVQPAGCPVDCLGLTEVVTQRVPQNGFSHPGVPSGPSLGYPIKPNAGLLGAPFTPVPGNDAPGGSAHTHGWFARECPRFPRPRVRRNSP